MAAIEKFAAPDPSTSAVAPPAPLWRQSALVDLLPEPAAWVPELPARPASLPLLTRIQQQPGVSPPSPMPEVAGYAVAAAVPGRLAPLPAPLPVSVLQGAGAPPAPGPGYAAPGAPASPQEDSPGAEAMGQIPMAPPTAPPSRPAAPMAVSRPAPGPNEGDVFLDGQLVGRWMSRFLNREAVRAFGGAQRVVVHKLIGGTRVIDVLGRDDAALQWSGILTGPDAADRARSFDAMRAAGAPLNLAWDAFCYAVVITELDLDFVSPWWIPYSIACTVISDLAQLAPVYMPDLADSVLADLSAAAAFADVSPAIAAVSAAGGLVSGSPALLASVAAVSAAQAGIARAIVTAGQGLGSNDLSALVSASLSLAQLACAQGYVGRVAANLAGDGT